MGIETLVSSAYHSNQYRFLLVIWVLKQGSLQDSIDYLMLFTRYMGIETLTIKCIVHRDRLFTRYMGIETSYYSEIFPLPHCAFYSLYGY